MWDVVGLVCLIVTVVFTLYLAFAMAWRMRRLTRLRAFAAENRLNPERPDRSLLALTRGAPFTSTTSSHTPGVRTLFTGAWKQYALRVYEFRRGLPFQIVAITLPRAYPFLQVTNRLLSRQRVDVVGAHQFDTGDEAFARRYRVDTVNNRFAELMLLAPTRVWLSSGERRKGFQWTVDGSILLTWRHGPPDAAGAQSVPMMADFLVEIADRIEETTRDIEF